GGPLSPGPALGRDGVPAEPRAHRLPDEPRRGPVPHRALQGGPGYAGPRYREGRGRLPCEPLGSGDGPPSTWAQAGGPRRPRPPPRQDQDARPARGRDRGVVARGGGTARRSAEAEEVRSHFNNPSLTPSPLRGPRGRSHSRQYRNRSRTDLLFPQAADHTQFALDRARHAAQLLGDLLDGVAFHLPQRDRLQHGFAKEVEQPLTFLGRLGRELRRRLPAQDLVQTESVVGGQLDGDGPAATLLAAFIAQVASYLAGSEQDQEPPEVVAVVQLRKPAVHCIAAEAVERAEGHVLLGAAPRRLAELLASQFDQARKVAFPQRLHRRRLAFPKLPDPVRNGPLWPHRPVPPQS